MLLGSQHLVQAPSTKQVAACAAGWGWCTSAGLLCCLQAVARATRAPECLDGLQHIWGQVTAFNHSHSAPKEVFRARAVLLPTDGETSRAALVQPKQDSYAVQQFVPCKACHVLEPCQAIRMPYGHAIPRDPMPRHPHVLPCTVMSCQAMQLGASQRAVGGRVEAHFTWSAEIDARKQVDKGFEQQVKDGTLEVRPGTVGGHGREDKK